MKRPLLTLLPVLAATFSVFGCDAAPEQTNDEPAQEQPAASAALGEEQCPDLCGNVCSGGFECSKSCNVWDEHDTDGDGDMDERHCKPTTCRAEVALPCSDSGGGGNGSGGDDGNGGGDDGGGDSGPWHFCDSFVCTNIVVHTCNVSGAGTDSTVKISVANSAVASPWFVIDRPNRDDNERNSWFDWTWSDPEGIRGPTSFSVFHDGKGDDSAWCFDTVNVRVSACPQHNDWEEFVYTGGTQWMNKQTLWHIPLTKVKSCK